MRETSHSVHAAKNFGRESSLRPGGRRQKEKRNVPFFRPRANRQNWSAGVFEAGGDAVDAFEDGVEELVAQLKAAPRAEGVNEILLPGEPEQRTEAARLAGGIPVSEELAAKLGELAVRLGVAPPAWA